MATEKPRFSLTVSEEMLKEIENYRFDHRFNKRNDAVVELIDKALKMERAEKEKSRADE